jgi:hypothetical protein
MNRIKEFLSKLLSIKVWSFTGLFIFTAYLILNGRISGGEYVAITLGLYGMLIGAREYSKQQYRAFDYAEKHAEEEKEIQIGFRENEN